MLPRHDSASNYKALWFLLTQSQQDREVLGVPVDALYAVQALPGVVGR